MTGGLRWVILGLLLLGTPGCIDGGPSEMIYIQGRMQRFFFSQDGKHIFLTYGHYLDDDVRWSVDTLDVYEVGTWKRALRYTNDTHSVNFAYSCADPDIVIHGEGPDPGFGPNQLTWRRISTGEKVAEMQMDWWPGWEREGRRFHCDMEDNVVYMDLYQGKIVAADGSTGEVLQEYLAPGQEDYAAFLVQKERDRLIRLDADEDLVRIYRLSTGELLHQVEAWSGLRPYQSPEYLLLDPDTLLYGLVAAGDGPLGSHVMRIDLAGGTVTRDYFMGELDFDDIYSMAADNGTLAVAMHVFEDLCSKLWILDLDSGAVTLGLDMCFMDWGGAMPIPQRDRFLACDWAHPSGAEAYFYLYDYPSFELLGEGRAPEAYEELQYSSRQDIVVMESYFSDHFGVYDVARGKMKDDFHLCTQIAGNSLAIDPTERWAAVMCYGNESSDPKPGATAKGAGVAIVDLDRYR